MFETVKNNSWGWTQARHLLNRSGFGGKPSEIEAFAKTGLESSVKELFTPKKRALQAPEWISEYNRFSLRELRSRSDAERRNWRRTNRQRVREFQVDWIERMIDSPGPSDMLWEKMTFFWHGHFATSAQKVKMPPILFTQLKLFHRHALGNFRDLLHGISRDPAMLRYLDNNQNRRGKPNENFARELMELFSLGPGNYTETDIKEAARAFTGWTNDPFKFKIRHRLHDHGRKTFLGQSGNFDGEDVVNIILAQPACAEFITKKLLAFFSFDASVEVMQTLAEEFRNKNYELQPLLKKIFLHKIFYSSNVIGSQIKSPIQLVVGTARTLDLEIESDEFLLYVLNLMGQVPYLPPNVKGWPGGKSWIDTSRLLTRYTLAELIGRGKIPEEIEHGSASDPGRSKNARRKSNRGRFLKRMMDGRYRGLEFDPNKLLSEQETSSEILDRLAKTLLAHELTKDEQAKVISRFEGNLNQMSRWQALKYLIGDMMALPAYQLC